MPHVGPQAPASQRLRLEPIKPDRSPVDDLLFERQGLLANDEAVASRRFGPAPLKAMWRRYRVRLTIAGAIVAFLLSVPLVNLAAPIIGVAFMLHLFEPLRRDYFGRYASV